MISRVIITGEDKECMKKRACKFQDLLEQQSNTQSGGHIKITDQKIFSFSSIHNLWDHEALRL